VLLAGRFNELQLVRAVERGYLRVESDFEQPIVTELVWLDLVHTTDATAAADADTILESKPRPHGHERTSFGRSDHAGRGDKRQDGIGRLRSLAQQDVRNRQPARSSSR
jgi:hypothetical protein